MISIGVDIGGSHISSVAVNIINGEILNETFSENRVNNSAEAEIVLHQWSSCIQKTIELSGSKELQGIGIAVPSPFDFQKGICLIRGVAKYENMYKVNVRQALKNDLNMSGSVPIRFINDAFAFGIGEAWKGKGKGLKNIVAITLGTGFGCTFNSEGIPLNKGDKVPEDGEIYHVPFNDGIADEYISTRWFLSEYKKLSGAIAGGVKEIAVAARKGDQAASGLFQSFGENIGTVLFPWLQKFGAEMLIVGGSIAGASDLFLTHLKNYLEYKGLYIPVEVSELKENAALLGCSRMADYKFNSRLEDGLYTTSSINI